MTDATRPDALSEAERGRLRIAVDHDETHGDWNTTEHVFAAVARIKADAYAAGLAARTPTATGDDLRDRVTEAVESLAGEMSAAAYLTLTSVLAASPAPVVSRPEAADAAQRLHAMAVEDNPGHADWTGCAITGPCRDEGERFARAASLATDPEAGDES